MRVGSPLVGSVFSPFPSSGAKAPSQGSLPWTSSQAWKSLGVLSRG
jgi:hypothetical protein